MRTTYHAAGGERPASRALNIAADRDHVVGFCAKHKATISAIETLHSGGTRVVLINGDDAARIRRAYGSKVMTGSVTRTIWARSG